MKTPKNCSIRYVHRCTARGDQIQETPITGDESSGGIFDQVIHGDAVHILSRYPNECVDLIVTSPPYADNRKKTYGGVYPDHYVNWFLPFTQQFHRVLNIEDERI